MEFLEVPLFDDDLFKLLTRFSINMVVALCVALGCYRSGKKNGGQFVFTFVLLNMMVFFICFTMKKLELELGMALGLFAIFAIIRYRTDPIPVKEMTYLFVMVGVAVINALSNKKTSYAELATTDVLIILAAFVLERVAYKPPRVLLKQSMIYDKMDLLGPDQREALLQDLRARTGLAVQEVKVSKIDLQKGTAMLNVMYTE